MDYTIPASTLKGYIKMEVSLAADEAYSDTGQSLYDSVVLTAKDETLLGFLINDAAKSLVRMMDDVATIHRGTGSSTPNIITFNVSDNPATSSANQGYIFEEIDRFIVNYACNEIFKQRRAILVPEYTSRTQASFDNVNALVRQRTAPTRS